MGISILPSFMILGAILSIWAVGMAAAVNNSSATGATLTAYEQLEAYNFPIGLLPLGVTAYDLDESTGKFTVTLGETCSLSLLDGTYSLKLQASITGYIETGTIYDIDGCGYKYLGVYIGITKVVRSSSILTFSIGGVLTLEFPVADFSACAECDSSLKYLGSRRSGKLHMPH